MPRADSINSLPLDRLFDHLLGTIPSGIAEFLRAARDEDLGAEGDITSAVMIPGGVRGRGAIRSRVSGRLAGLALLPHVRDVYAERSGENLSLEFLCADGDALEAGQAVARLDGSVRAMLGAERLMLNLLCHLSGIATLTARHVEATAGTAAKIYDTRKTVPGLRALAKYAVRCGGGHCHRLGLYDAVLIKDNHLAHCPAAGWQQRVEAAVAEARRDYAPHFVEIEVDTLEQLREALALPVDVILLDNMTADEIARAVTLRDERRPDVQLEASGGITLETVRAMAQAGVDRIAVGALTHSAPSLDLGLDIA